MFANLNKVDKLEPESFALWMSIMRRVPGSVLWLMSPSASDEEVSRVFAFTTVRLAAAVDYCMHWRHGYIWSEGSDILRCQIPIRGPLLSFKRVTQQQNITRVLRNASSGKLCLQS